MSAVSVGSLANRLGEEGVVREGRGSNRRRRGPRLRYLSLVALLLLWFVADKADWISAGTFPGPGAVWDSAVDLAKSGKLTDALQVSLTRVVVGGLIGGVLGILVGLVSGFSHLAESVLDTPLQALRAVPFTALVPIFILWLGIGEAPKIAIVAFAVFFPIYINTYAGIRSVDVKYAEVAQVYGLGRLAVARRGLLPGALPNILVGIRYALALSWISVIVAEQLNASSGIGFLLVNARQFLQVDVMFVCLVLYALLGVLTDLAYRVVERRLLVWRRGFDGA
jgi:sulfonate transport system permease protein